MTRILFLCLLIFSCFNSFCQEMGFTVGPIGPTQQEISTLYIKPIYMDSCLSCSFPSDPTNDWSLSTSLSDHNFDTFITEFKYVIDSLDYINLDSSAHSATATSFKFYNMMGEKLNEYIVSNKDALISLITLLQDRCSQHSNYDFYGLFRYLIISYEHLSSMDK